MKLADWLFENSTTPGQLRRMLGVDKATVQRYLVGKRTPRPDILNTITTITDGAVTLADFRDPSPPDCAILIEDEADRNRMILPWSPEYASLSEGPHQSSRITAPVQRAIYALKGRAWFTPSGTYLLDGRISDPRRIVTQANELLQAQSKPLIPYPGVHAVEARQRAESAPQSIRKKDNSDD